MSKLKCIMCDWDGTILPSLRQKALNAALIFSNEFDVDQDSVFSAYLKFSGIPRRSLFNKILEYVGIGPMSDEVFKHLSNLFSNRNLSSFKELELYDDALPFFNECRARDIKLFVSSSAVQEELVEIVEYKKIGKYFEDVLGSSNSFSKGIGHCSYVCEKYSFDLDNIVMVGDDLSDIELANKAGVRSYRIVRGLDSKSKDIITSLSDIFLVESLS